MTNDPYKGMAVIYNHLNLPTQFSLPGNKVISILYNGAGQKLRKTVTDNGTLQYRQDYTGGIEYRSTSSVSLSLESIYHAEGRVFNTNVGTPSADALRYEYSIKDHLGNARLSFTDKNGNGVVDVTNTASNEILQENHYYPFGLAMNGSWMNDAAIDNKYQYNGKEMNDDFGLGWNDYGARWYDAALGRWWSVDPLSMMFNNASPYAYANSNPINFIDVFGLSAEKFTDDHYYDPSGKEVVVIKNNESDRYFNVERDDNGNWTVTGERNSKPINYGLPFVHTNQWDNTDKALNWNDPFWGAATHQLGKVVEKRLAYTSAAQKTSISRYFGSGAFSKTKIPTLIGSVTVNSVAAYKTARALKVGGVVLGGAGIVMSTTEAVDGYLRNDDMMMLKGIIGIGMGVLGFTGGPVGLAVSATYFLVIEPMIFDKTTIAQ